MLKEQSQTTEEGKLVKKQTRRLLTWGHGYFEQRLIRHAEIYGKTVIITDEHYTTKTCGNCFHLNEVGAKEELSCSNCFVKIDRDINASRNILIRTLARLSRDNQRGRNYIPTKKTNLLESVLRKVN